MTEAIDYMFNKVDELDLSGRNVLIPIGPSRTGKGTLIAALQGISLKVFKKSKRKVKESDVGRLSSNLLFMAPS